jgi:hypothetical protein
MKASLALVVKLALILEADASETQQAASKFYAVMGNGFCRDKSGSKDPFTTAEYALAPATADDSISSCKDKCNAQDDCEGYAAKISGPMDSHTCYVYGGATVVDSESDDPAWTCYAVRPGPSPPPAPPNMPLIASPPPTPPLTWYTDPMAMVMSSWYSFMGFGLAAGILAALVVYGLCKCCCDRKPKPGSAAATEKTPLSGDAPSEA